MSGEPQRRLILHMSVSLDGFSAPGRGTSGSVDRGDARHHANLEMLGRAWRRTHGRRLCGLIVIMWRAGLI